MLQDRAMLANLTIHAWTGHRIDKTVSYAIEVANNARNAGAFNKQLISRTALLPIGQITSKIRDMHYRRTLPWGDNGDRLLPSSMYMEYTAAIRKLRGLFDDAVHAFVQAYPMHVANARNELGTMYEPKDYPDVNTIRQRFGIDVSYLPVPDAKDFRVDVGAEEVETIKQNITAQVMKQQAGAIQALWDRLHTVVAHVHVRLSVTDAIFKDTLVDNVRDTVEILRKLNITQDEHIEKVLNEAYRHLLVPPQRIRDDPVIRARVAKAAKEIMETIPRDI